MIVLVFVMCWTPYYFISAWWWFDKESASKLDSRLQSGLFMFAVSNSCMDPIVYGCFSLDFIREFKRCCCLSKVRREEAAQRIYTQNSIYRSNMESTRSKFPDSSNGIKNQSSRQQLLNTLNSDHSIADQINGGRTIHSLDEEIEILSETPLCDSIQSM